MSKEIYVKKDSLTLMMTVSGLVFIINPLLGILTASFYAINNKGSNSVKIVIALLVLYLSALNTTKTIDGDMVEYIDMFDSVPFNGFIGTLQYTSFGMMALKDVGYGSIVYLLYYILFGNQYLFVFIVSSIIFSLVFLSIYKLSTEYKFPNFLIVSQLLVLAFFTQYFSLSFHLVRQELATSFFFFALSYKSQSFKKYLFWCVVAITFHSSIIVIVLISSMPFMMHRLTIKKVVLLLVFALSFVFISTIIGSYLSGFVLGGQMGDNVSRMANIVGAEDTSGDSFAKTITLFSSLMLVLSIIEVFRKKNSAYPIVVNLCFVWCALVLGLTAAPLIQYRFFFIIYTFIPFIIFLVFKSNKVFLKLSCFIVVSFLIFRFYYNLNNVFYYVPIGEAIFDPYFMLIRLS